MLKGETLLEATNLFYPNEYEKNDKTMPKYFRQNLKSCNCNVCNKNRKLNKTKLSNIFKKTFSLSIVYIECAPEYEKKIKEEESTEILKLFV